MKVGRKEDTALKGVSRPERSRSRREEEKQGPQWSALDEYARGKIQGWIQDLLEEEITELLGRGKSERRMGVEASEGSRNGHAKPRRLAMMAGTVAVRRPRVRGVEERFESRVLPLFVGCTEEVGELLAQLYLHGLAQGDFEPALRGHRGTNVGVPMGDGAPLSPCSIERLRAKWQLGYEDWSKRRIEELDVVYAWAAGIYVKAGLEETKAAVLVIIGALKEGRKVVLALSSGQRESEESRARVLRDLGDRGLRPRGTWVSGRGWRRDSHKPKSCVVGTIG